jgi:hypothetical protein
MSKDMVTVEFESVPDALISRLLNDWALMVQDKPAPIPPYAVRLTDAPEGYPYSSDPTAYLETVYNVLNGLPESPSGGDALLDPEHCVFCRYYDGVWVAHDISITIGEAPESKNVAEVAVNISFDVSSGDKDA